MTYEAEEKTSEKLTSTSFTACHVPVFSYLCEVKHNIIRSLKGQLHSMDE